LKKLLAAVTVTALALTMLTACGSDGSKNTFTLVDYLNDLLKSGSGNYYEGVETTFKADTTLDANAKSVADILKSAGIKTIRDVETKVEKDETFGDKLAAAAGVNEQTKNKYLYEITYTEINQKWITDTFKDNESTMQAMALLANGHEMNVPEAMKKYYNPEEPDWGSYIDYTKLEGTTSVGTATVELGGKTYLIAVFRTAVKA